MNGNWRIMFNNIGNLLLKNKQRINSVSKQWFTCPPLCCNGLFTDLENKFLKPSLSWYGSRFRRHVSSVVMPAHQEHTSTHTNPHEHKRTHVHILTHMNTHKRARRHTDTHEHMQTHRSAHEHSRIHMNTRE